MSTYKKVKYAVVLSLVLSSFTCYSMKWKLSNAILEMGLDGETGLIEVTDLRTHQTWNQVPPNNTYNVDVVEEHQNSFLVRYRGAAEFMVLYTRKQASIEVTVKADEKMIMEDLEFPAAFQTPNKNYYLLETDGEGLLLPVDENGYPLGNGITYFCGGGLSMAWMGVVDSKFGNSYMAVPRFLKRNWKRKQIPVGNLISSLLKSSILKLSSL